MGVWCGVEVAENTAFAPAIPGRRPPLAGEKENPCSRLHARNSERGAAALRACRLAAEVVNANRDSLSHRQARAARASARRRARWRRSRRRRCWRGPWRATCRVARGARARRQPPPATRWRPRQWWRRRRARRGCSWWPRASAGQSRCLCPEHRHTTSRDGPRAPAAGATVGVYDARPPPPPPPCCTYTVPYHVPRSQGLYSLRVTAKTATMGTT